MAITYKKAPDIDARVQKIARSLQMKHINERVVCVRSIGSRSRWTLARCYALPGAFQAALGVQTHYVIEVIGRQFDKLPEPEKTKTLIHEMLHIPKAFGGGLKSHKYVNSRKVNRLYKKLRDHIMERERNRETPA